MNRKQEKRKRITAIVLLFIFGGGALIGGVATLYLAIFGNALK